MFYWPRMLTHTRIDWNGIDSSRLCLSGVYENKDGKIKRPQNVFTTKAGENKIKRGTEV